ncbi:alpha-L-rhamnosidase C-terminal domain-containing protein [Pontiella sp.]|uniref:alpha-L-rhamnosidase-related protein n=1 Tax=Pontiella sp. TaxID=2837462 RepID=UPI0035696562
MGWKITGGALLSLVCMCAHGAPTQRVDERPVEISRTPAGIYVVDFGRVAFGNLRLTAPASGTVTVHFGEASKDDRIDRKPPQTVRYNTASVELKANTAVVAAPPVDKRNTDIASPKHPPAILTPDEWGVVMPFRWVEIEGWTGALTPDQIVRQSVFAATWDDAAASFESSDAMLDRIWELCRYSIKATTFAGVYVDGDRERIPYEADAYLNQLSHYYTDFDKQMARDTFDRLMEYPTWPTEWAPHMVFMAHADWMHTGDADWLKPRYEALKTKTLMERRGADGLVASDAKDIKRDDIIDWPVGERDGYVRTGVNTVVNAFHIRSLEMMAELARAVGRNKEAGEFDSLAHASRERFQKTLFDAETGLFRDGAETDHTALHANLFPLAFGLVPQEARAAMAGWLAQRGMRCSVYAAQYLMEALFENGADEQALELILAENDRSWRHMVESGTTITWEAWDHKYKSNQDWNHAWGAAPANLLPRYVLGVEPLAPGWKTARIRPCVGGLEFAKGQVPTPRGAVRVAWKKPAPDRFSLSIVLPQGMDARVELPFVWETGGILCNGRPVKATPVGDRWVVDQAVEGTAVFEVRKN